MSAEPPTAFLMTSAFSPLQTRLSVLCDLYDYCLSEKEADSVKENGAIWYAAVPESQVRTS